MKVLVGERRRTVAALVLFSIASGSTEAAILAVLAQIAVTLVNKASAHAGVGLLHVHLPITTLFAIAGGLALLRLMLQAPMSILPARISADVQARMRTRLFHAFTRASWEVQSQDREGHLQEIMTSQVLQATNASLQTANLVIALFTFVVLMVTAVVLNPLAAGLVLVGSVLVFASLRPLRAMGVNRSRALSRAQVEYAGGLGEAIRVAEETHVFGVAGAQRSRSDRLAASARDLFYRTQVVGRLVGGIYQSVIYLLLVAFLYALYETGRAHVASIGAIVLLLVRAGLFGQQIQGSWQGLRQSLPFIERLQAAERRYTESVPPEGTQSLQAVRTLAFEHVYFSYSPGRPVLSDVSFEVLAGETVGIIGPSGAGKSTLIQILLRLRAPREGRYLVNGMPAERFASEDWHRQVAYVPQEPRLLHASVAANIRYFRPIDDEAVKRAGQLAGIHEEIMAWPNGYDTIVGPRADAVSGGQQQRICLARALAARPEVLVLDEPTSALDPHSEILIQKSLSALKHDLTLFIIAHRMSTLDICERVMVIIDGQLSAFATVSLLREQSDYYRSASMIAAGTGGGGLL
ncbi:MAG TPA: ABC transporter ATP-binding protein [Solirubrobacteraceae bacterium]|jgi:ATP-binding cassette subfamily B protein|nr:ABC transporter ATP-binding protein [Solirubrobacteraceae bacterium]